MDTPSADYFSNQTLLQSMIPEDQKNILHNAIVLGDFKTINIYLMYGLCTCSVIF